MSVPAAWFAGSQTVVRFSWAAEGLAPANAWETLQPLTSDQYPNPQHSAIACLWAGFATAIFCLPIELPVDAENLNYASVALGGTFLISNIW